MKKEFLSTQNILIGSFFFFFIISPILFLFSASVAPEKRSKNLFLGEEKVEKSDEKHVETIVYVNKTPIIVEKDRIRINLESGEETKNSHEITKEMYPNLFARYDRIRVEPVADKRNNRDYVVFASESSVNNKFGVNYFIVLDLQSKQVVYESPQFSSSSFLSYTFSDDGSEISLSSYPYLFNSSMENSALPVIEFVSFNPRENRFVLSNSRHRSAFEDVKKVYDLALEDCYYYRRQVNDVDDMIRSFGGDIRCDDYGIPDKPVFNNSAFIYLGQFLSVREKLSKIIAGENISMVANDSTLYVGQQGYIETSFTDEDKEAAVIISKRQSLFSKYPELMDYVLGHNVLLMDMMEFKSDPNPIVIFQSVPGPCGSCATRIVEYYYKGVIKEIEAGHEIHHNIITHADGTPILEVKYGIIDDGGNSGYKWSMLNQYRWNEETNTFDKISSKRVPSPYSKQ